MSTPGCGGALICLIKERCRAFELGIKRVSGRSKKKKKEEEAEDEFEAESEEKSEEESEEDQAVEEEEEGDVRST